MECFLTSKDTAAKQPCREERNLLSKGGAFFFQIQGLGLPAIGEVRKLVQVSRSKKSQISPLLLHTDSCTEGGTGRHTALALFYLKFRVNQTWPPSVRL